MFFFLGKHRKSKKSNFVNITVDRTYPFHNPYYDESQ